MAAILAVGITCGIVFPMAKRIKQINEDIYNQRLALEKLYLRGQSIKQSRKDYDQIKDKVNVLDNTFNRLGQELGFITSLEKIAKEQNIKQIINIDSNHQTEGGAYEKIQVDIKLTGTFPEILYYLDKIETLDYYFNIDYLNFYYPEAGLFKADDFNSENSQLTKSNINPRINAVISGLTYWK